jgi:hypothetical protein
VQPGEAVLVHRCVSPIGAKGALASMGIPEASTDYALPRFKAIVAAGRLYNSGVQSDISDKAEAGSMQGPPCQ